MKISINWINEFVDLSNQNIPELIERFTLSCAEVEGVEYKGENTHGIIVAKILEIANHPNSDHLHLLKLDIGGGKTTECVCGAPNVRVGMLVPFATLGASVNGFEIVKANIRGVDSIGMCCSGKELGISDDNSGLLELFGVQTGTDFVKYAGLKDAIFEIDNKSLTNRPDLWCHYGIAREIAALVNRPLKKIETANLEKFNNLPKLNIGNIDSEKCYRYSAIKIENVTVKKSPLQMQVRLFYCGMRAINLLTDLTNYVMLEVSQPMHAFDARQVGKISVEQTKEPMKFTTLDGVERNIPAHELMICSNGVPVAIAGIMGGLNSETEQDTSAIVLESANFDGVAVRKLTSKLGLRTESSIRYEKILDPEIVSVATSRFINLLSKIDPEMKVSTCYANYYAKHFKPVHLSVSKSYLDAYIGIDIPAEKIIKILSSLDFTVCYANSVFEIDVPSFRATKDITKNVDIVEEITRVYGYANIHQECPKIDLKPVYQNQEHLDELESKLFLAKNLDYNEIHSFIWADKTTNQKLGLETVEKLRIVNSIAPECTYIRSVVLPSLICKIEENKSDDFKIFEIARAVSGLTQDNLAIEEKKLAMVISRKDATEIETIKELRDDILKLTSSVKNASVNFVPCTYNFSWIHPVNSCDIVIDGEVVGYISQLHPNVKNKIDKKLSVAVCEINFEKFSKTQKHSILFNAVSKYQPVSVDLNFVANSEMPYSALSDAIKQTKTALSYTFKLVDIYKNAETLGNNISYTFNFDVVSHDKTLTCDEINEFMNSVIASCEKIGAKLR